MNKSILPLVLAALAFGIGIAFGLSKQSPTAIDLNAGTLLEPARTIAPFNLATATDASFDNDDLRDQWTLIFFGFTNCPDICPTTLQLLSDIRAQLPDTTDEPLLIALISVDPARDDVQTLATYVNYFGDQLIGATGDDQETLSFATDLGIVYQRVELEGQGEYTMDHSGAVLLVDPTARLRAVFSPPLSRDAMLADLQQLIL